VKQPLFVFKKPLHEAATLPLSGSHSVVSVRLSSKQELLLHSTRSTPDCTSPGCWLTPRFEVGSSCSTTPCSSKHCAGDDVVSAASPCSSITSSSSATPSCGQLRTLQTQADIISADVPPTCSEPCEMREPCETSASETARLPDELVPSSMHSTAECPRPPATSSSEPLHAHLTIQDLIDR